MPRTVIALFALAVLAAGGTPAPAQQDAGDPVVARVNESEIRQSDVRAAFESLPERFRRGAGDALYMRIVQQLVDGRLILDAGRADGLGEDAEVREQVAEFERSAIQQIYMRRLVGAGLTEGDLRAAYDTTVAAAGGPLEVRASHILLESEQDGYDVIEALEGGADFAGLARERSAGPSAPHGGDLGYFVRSAMVKPFADAAFAIEPGTVGPDPVRTEFGWHVIKVVDRRRGPTPTFEEARPELEERLTRELIAAHMAQLRAGAEIELFNLDGSPTEGAPRQ